MSIRPWCASLSGFAIALVPLTQGIAHEIVGNRFFPATLGIDDPGVNDELSLPTVANFKTGDDPSFRQRDFSGEFSKRITEAFAISFGSTFSSFAAPGGPTGMGASGFQNLETTSSKIEVDRRFMRHGIKRWVTRYTDVYRAEALSIRLIGAGRPTNTVQI